MAQDAYRDFLVSVPLFADCNDHELDEIGRVADEVKLEDGRVFAQQGSIGQELFIIAEGAAVVTRDGATIATLGPGDWVGELSVLGHTRRNATVTASGDVTVLVLTPAGLDQLLDDIPGLAKRLLKVVAARLSVNDDSHQS
jgi:CRP-like cAMP-binding protein